MLDNQSVWQRKIRRADIKYIIQKKDWLKFREIRNALIKELTGLSQGGKDTNTHPGFGVRTYTVIHEITFLNFIRADEFQCIHAAMAYFLGLKLSALFWARCVNLFFSKGVRRLR